MRFWLKNLALAPLVAILACPMLMTGCKTQSTTEYVQQEPSDYAQWEHRQHVVLEKRSAEEKKEYRDWHQHH